MTFEGQIDEILPDGRFGVILENGHRVIVYTAGRMRRFPIRSGGGGAGRVAMTAHGRSKGPPQARHRPARARPSATTDNGPRTTDE